MKSFICRLVIVSALVILIGCKEKQKVITGYDTEHIFISDYSKEDINSYTRKGWEIKGIRRAYKESDDIKIWGTEYTVQKAIYSEYK